MTDTSFQRAGMGRATTRHDGDLALCVCLEPLLDRARLLVLGNLDRNVRALLMDLVDDLACCEESSLDDDLDLPFADLSFDVVWLLDSALIRPTSRAIGEMKRVLTRDGALVVASSVDPDERRSSSPESGLTRALGPAFDDLRLFRQSSVFARALEQIGAQRGGVVVDRSLVSHLKPAPERIVAVASESPLRLDPHLWVEERAPKVESHHESLQERLKQVTAQAHTLSLTLDAAEIDLEDAFSRIQGLDTQLREKDTATAHEREQRIRTERALEHAKAVASDKEKAFAAAEAALAASQAEFETLSTEFAELEKRLAERAGHVQSLEADKKRSEEVARDLIEDVRHLEQQLGGSADLRHRLTDLEHELERARERATEAERERDEAIREATELQTRVGQLEARPLVAVDPTVESALFGLRLRVRELEQSLAEARLSAGEQTEQIQEARGQITGLTLRLAETERALSHATAANASAASEYAERLRSLERELEEADRFAGAHADDGDRIEALENELTRTQCRKDDMEDELRVAQETLRAAEQHARAYESELLVVREELRALLEGTRATRESLDSHEERHRALEEELSTLRGALREARDDLHTTRTELQATQGARFAAETELRAAREEAREARGELAQLSVESSARIELAQRRENEARLERDHARMALDEARTILAQLTGKPAGASDPSVS